MKVCGSDRKLWEHWGELGGSQHFSWSSETVMQICPFVQWFSICLKHLENSSVNFVAPCINFGPLTGMSNATKKESKIFLSQTMAWKNYFMESLIYWVVRHLKKDFGVALWYVKSMQLQGTYPNIDSSVCFWYLCRMWATDFCLLLSMRYWMNVKFDINNSKKRRTTKKSLHPK